MRGFLPLLCFVLASLPFASSAGLMTTGTCVADIEAMKARCEVTRLEMLEAQKTMHEKQVVDAVQAQKAADQSALEQTVQSAYTAEWIFAAGGGLLGLILGFVLGRRRSAPGGAAALTG